jgi:hypothetical protein
VGTYVISRELSIGEDGKEDIHNVVGEGPAIVGVGRWALRIIKEDVRQQSPRQIALPPQVLSIPFLNETKGVWDCIKGGGAQAAGNGIARSFRKSGCHSRQQQRFPFVATNLTSPEGLIHRLQRAAESESI